jgi:hypothetical protein
MRHEVMDVGEMFVLIESFPDGENRCVERTATNEGKPDHRYNKPNAILPAWPRAQPA